MTTLLAALAVSISWMVVDSSTITINVPIEVVGGTDDMLAIWARGIDDTWNRGNDGRPFEVCGRKVIFNATFHRRPKDAQVPRNVHVVVVEEVELVGFIECLHDFLKFGTNAAVLGSDVGFAVNRLEALHELRDAGRTDEFEPLKIHHDVLRNRVGAGLAIVF